MTYYPDLSPYEFTIRDAPALNVGWLDSDHVFPTGEVAAAAFDRLIRHGASPVHVTRGVHDCQLCEAESPFTVWTADGSVRAWLGFSEIHVVGTDGIRYAAPSLIVHYIAAHGYLPPIEFIEAVMFAEATPELLPLGTLAPSAGAGPWRGAHLDRSEPMNKSERRNVIQYMEGCPTVEAWMCATQDEIGDKFWVSGGCNIASDGTWYWRLDAIEYIRHYGIRIPRAAMLHFEERDWTAPQMSDEGERAVKRELERMFPN